MWTYNQLTGELLRNSEFIGTGYSGTGLGHNNPLWQDIHNVGPIPKGIYQIGESRVHPKLGPIVMNLDPIPTTEVFGRSAFRIHGDNSRHDASHGCIILGPSIRKQISDSNDKLLQVI